MFAQLRSLLHYFLAGAQQIPILFLHLIGWLHDGQQVIGEELRQVAGIDSIGLDGFAAWTGNTAGRNNIAMMAVG